MSMLGTTNPRKIDCIVPVYAVNSLGGAYYSFSTSTSIPAMSSNLSQLILTSFPEYSQLARTYGLVQLKSIGLVNTRSSALIQNFNIIGNTPSYMLQVSMTNYPTGSTTAQQSLATSDNSVEINLQSFDGCEAVCLIPPAVVGRSNSSNDIYIYGSDVWCPTVINGVQTFPDIYLNLGSLSFPTFQSTAAQTAYLVSTIHVTFDFVFAGTQSL
jgi:hypothetical protein